jgi:hypothetical protein
VKEYSPQSHGDTEKKPTAKRELTEAAETTEEYDSGVS